MIQHTDPNKNPHQNQDVHSGSLPNFNDIVNPAGAPGQVRWPRSSARQCAAAKFTIEWDGSNSSQETPVTR